MPYQNGRKILRNNFEEEYYGFKRRLIEMFLKVSQPQDFFNQPPQELMDTIEKLTNINKFKNFFQKSDISTDPRNIYWYAVVNGIQEDQGLLNEIMLELNLFRKELQFVLSKVDIDDASFLKSMRGLDRLIFTHKNTYTESYNIDSLQKFLWEIFSGGNVISGYTGKDSIKEFIDKI
jgi:hypothetical protein